MASLQSRLDESKEAFESAAPPHNAPHEASETMDRATTELRTLGLVLPIQFPRNKTTGIKLALPPTVKKDVYLDALLEVPTTKQPRRSPLQWVGAMGLHLVILATLIIVPLYITGTIHLSEHEEVQLIAPPPPPPPAPTVAATAPRVVRPRAELPYKLRRFTAPAAIPKKVSLGDTSVAPPDLGGVVGGVPSGVVGGQIGGVLGGVLGGTGPSAPPALKPTPKLVRVGSNLKAPRQTYSVDPIYPTLAMQARIHGTVMVDAIIDEQGNVVQARAISGHPLLIPAALEAVLQWKYEPTSLNGRPISVELKVLVNFK
jgi:periplasmic protein TonB